MAQSPHAPEFAKLVAFLCRVPGISTNLTPSKGIGSGRFENGTWWVKFRIDIHHPLVWSVVQEFGCVLNFVSIAEHLPTVFMPVSPAPYLNGGPKEYLSWVISCPKVKLISCPNADFTPDDAAGWLEGRMPRPVEDPNLWPINQEEFS